MPECENSSSAIWNNSWAEYSIPKQNNLFGSCEHYTVKDDLSGTCSSSSFTEKISKCDTWVYDPKEKTILNEVIARKTKKKKKSFHLNKMQMTNFNFIFFIAIGLEFI